jgi:hypothetical protein
MRLSPKPNPWRQFMPDQDHSVGPPAGDQWVLPAPKP